MFIIKYVHVCVCIKAACCHGVLRPVCALLKKHWAQTASLSSETTAVCLFPKHFPEY